MKKFLIVVIVLVAVGVGIFAWGVSKYNGLVEKQESVETAWAQVENVYQRRMDLVPNLVNTVKGYAKHEKETLDAVMNARAKATQMTVDVDDLSEENIRKFQEAQGELQQAMGRLMMITESYPDLKANENFLTLQSQLEGTENRITVERQKFNETAKVYNTAVRKFPTSIIASMCDFEKKGYFEAQEGAEKAPVVEF